MDLFAIGEIVKTRGLRGCLKVLSYVETKDIFQNLILFILKITSGKKIVFDLKKIDISGKYFLLNLKVLTMWNQRKLLSAVKFICRKIF